MTEKLKNLMDEVTGMVDQDFAVPDLEAITTAGDRVVRRRRVLVGTAGLAAAAVVATAVVLLGGGDRENRADFTDGHFGVGVPLWTEGSVLHTPDSTYDLGVDVVTLVRTADGVAYIGDDRGVYVFDGRASDRIGTSVDSEWSGLVGDSDGTWVGWISDAGEQRDYVARDLSTGAEFRDPVRVDPHAEEPLDNGMFLAIDGTTGYRLDARGTLRTDLGTGESTVVGEADHPTMVVGAEDGFAVHWIEDRSGGDIGTDVVDGDGRVVLGHDGGRTVGALSPDATWAADLERGAVWEVGTGREVTLDTGSPGDAIGYDWLDGDSLMVLAEVPDDDKAIRLLRCEVRTGSCAEVTALELTGARFALPSFGLFSAVQFGGEASGSASSEATEVATVEVPPSSSTERPE